VVATEVRIFSGGEALAVQKGERPASASKSSWIEQGWGAGITEAAPQIIGPRSLPEYYLERAGPYRNGW
jgi:hypothetical protein